MSHEFIHWHEGGLLGSAKPTNLLVANIWEPDNCLKVIPFTLIKDLLCEMGIFGALLNNVGPLGETYILKTMTHEVKQYWTIFLLGFKELSLNLQLEVRKRECREVLGSKLCLVGRDVSCDVLQIFFEGNLDSIKLFQAFFNQLVWHAIGN